MKSRAPQLHLEYRFYKQLGQAGKPVQEFCNILNLGTVLVVCMYMYLLNNIFFIVS